MMSRAGSWLTGYRITLKLLLTGRVFSQAGLAFQRWRC
jgi:hypothetical protein